MKVLIACEYSGRVRDAFLKKGHDAWSCDLLPSESDPGRHYQCDIRDIIKDSWDLIIAHPECTYLCNSGVTHLHKDVTRWLKLFDAADFFRLFIKSAPKVAIENPIMHKYAKKLIGSNQSQVIHPWMFGHMEQKATCLWLYNLPNLKPTNDVRSEMMQLPDNKRQRLHYLPPSKDRWKERSRTYQGIADAMAEQWG